MIQEENIKKEAYSANNNNNCNKHIFVSYIHLFNSSQENLPQCLQGKINIVFLLWKHFCIYSSFRKQVWIWVSTELWVNVNVL